MRCPRHTLIYAEEVGSGPSARPAARGRWRDHQRHRLPRRRPRARHRRLLQSARAGDPRRRHALPRPLERQRTRAIAAHRRRRRRVDLGARDTISTADVSAEGSTGWRSSSSPWRSAITTGCVRCWTARSQIDGVDPVFMTLPPEEIFFRAFRSIDFDICELSMSSFTVNTAERNCPYVGVPAFVSRMFRHNSIYVRRDRVKSPANLKGRRVGLPEYQLTACVWARIILEDDHGVKPSDLHLGPGRGGGSGPAGEDHDQASIRRAHGRCAGRATPSPSCLERGDIDGFIAPRTPASRPETIPTSDGSFPTRLRPAGTISGEPASFPSCT